MVAEQKQEAVILRDPKIKETEDRGKGGSS